MRRLNSAALPTLRFFEAAARLQSVSRAAEELCVTQGAVSQNIKSLEECLGCKLFFRLPGQIKLTDDGKRFAEVVNGALQELEGAAETLIRPNDSRNNLRVRANSSFALRWLIPRLGQLQARHPKIRLHVLGDDRDFDPARRDYDLAITLAQAPPPGLRAELLMEEYLTPVCSSEYLSTRPFLRSPASLARCTLLHERRASQPATEDTEWRYWLNHAGARGVDSNQGQFFMSIDMAIEAALVHQGVALGRLSLLEGPLARTLVAPFSPRIVSRSRYHLVFPRDPADHPGLKDLVDWLHNEARNARNAYPHASSDNGRADDGSGDASADMPPDVNRCAVFRRTATASIRLTAT